jgi:hypothetical protein
MEFGRKALLCDFAALSGTPTAKMYFAILLLSDFAAARFPRQNRRNTGKFSA